ncbi:MAG: AI-2E family transporter [Bacteroidales bacterium]|nr:AI-2E family transporter [Bacteroidales bacterium]
MNRAGRAIMYIALIVIGIHFLFIGLTNAKTFLAPIVIGVLLTMLVLPLARKLESWGFPKALSAFFADLVIVLFSFVFFLIISAQIRVFINDWPTIREQLKPEVERIQDYVEKQTGISIREQIPAFILDESRQAENAKSKPQAQSPQTLSETASNALLNLTSTVMEFFGFLGNVLLMFVYIYFFLLYRHRFKNFVLKLVQEKGSEPAEIIITGAGRIAQRYLAGKFILILVLAILYSIGLIIVGMDFAVFAAIIAALLSLIPFLGNIIGGLIAGILALVSGGGFADILGIIIVFSIAQFIENYILEPYIVGRQVDINPIVAIIAVVLGGIVWGIEGMVVAIPVTGIIKVIFDHISVMQPFGYLLGDDTIQEQGGIMPQVKHWFGKHFKKNN